MDVTTRNRAELKSYFVKNSIPTERNFAELIDGMLNQRDDGFVKLPGNPLSIEAAGDNASEKKALSIYQNFGDQNPAWTLSLNPRSNANDPGTAKLGFSIGDGEGRSRLFIDRNAGNVGIGTSDLRASLHVKGNAAVLALEGSDHAYIEYYPDGLGKGRKAWLGFGNVNDNNLTITNEIAGANIVLNGNVGIGTPDAKARLHVHGGRLRVSESDGANGSGVIELSNGPKTNVIFTDGSGGHLHVRTDSAAHHVLLQTGGTQGNVGIGTTTPRKQLHIQGISSARFMSDGHDRPGLAITGNYPEIDLFSGVNNTSHGPTIRLGAFDDNNQQTFKQWSIGTAGRSATFLDIGFSDANDSNPHNGIRNYNGKTILTLLSSGNVGIGTTDPKAKLDITASATTWGGWYEAIRFSQAAHSAITHPGGNLLFGLHSDRRFYFADTAEGQYIMTIDANPAGGNVGIGTTGPGARLHVHADTKNDGNNTAVFTAPNCGPWASHIHWGVNGDWYIRSASSAGTVIIQDNDGFTRVGGNKDGAFMQFHDDLWFSDPQNGTLEIKNGANNNWGTMVGNFRPPSSITYKKEVTPLREPEFDQLLQDTLQTDLVRFRYIGDTADLRLKLGVIAEDSPVYIVGEDGKTLSPPEYTAMLHGAIKALASRLVALEREVRGKS